MEFPKKEPSTQEWLEIMTANFDEGLPLRASHILEAFPERFDAQGVMSYLGFLSPEIEELLRRGGRDWRSRLSDTISVLLQYCDEDLRYGTDLYPEAVEGVTLEYMKEKVECLGDYMCEGTSSVTYENLDDECDFIKCRSELASLRAVLMHVCSHMEVDEAIGLVKQVYVDRFVAEFYRNRIDIPEHLLVLASQDVFQLEDELSEWIRGMGNRVLRSVTFELETELEGCSSGIAQRRADILVAQEDERKRNHVMSDLEREIAEKTRKRLEKIASLSFNHFHLFGILIHEQKLQELMSVK